jgi:flotillin
MSQNQEAVIAQQIAERLPEIVAAAASPFEHISNFNVLNGAQGVTGALAEIIQQAGALTGMARESLLPAITNSGKAQNGSAPRHSSEDKAAGTTKPAATTKPSSETAPTAAAKKAEPRP